jgi:hypothetical protein
VDGNLEVPSMINNNMENPRKLTKVGHWYNMKEARIITAKGIVQVLKFNVDTKENSKVLDKILY